jgi:hypothetical protein
MKIESYQLSEDAPDKKSELLRVEKNSFTDEMLARVVKRHDERDTRDLPNYLSGLAHVGSFTDIKVPVVSVVGAEGKPHDVIDSETPVLLGQTTLEETRNFLIDKFIKINPPDFRGEPQESKEYIRKIWSKAKEELETTMTEESYLIIDTRIRFEQKAREVGTSDEFKKGEGEIYREYVAELNKIYLQTITKLKDFAARVAGEMAQNPF